MRSTSDAFKAAIAQSQRAVVKVEVLSGGAVIDMLTADPAATTSTGAAAITGTVTLDSRAASRGRFDLTLVDDGTLGLVPTTAASLLAPYGNEIRVYRGVQFSDGTAETPSVGIFRIDTATIDDSPAGMTIALSGLDRSATVADAKFEEPYEVAAGTPVQDAILAVVQHAIPDVVAIFPGVTFTTPQLRADEGSDRWRFAQDMATACGLELYFDGDGALRLAPLAGGEPVATLAEGDGGVLLSAARGWTRETTRNRWIVTGENTGEAAPVRGVATDLDPTSPTYYFGPFGKVPEFRSSPFVATAEQAEAAASYLLQRQLGTTQSVSFGVIVDPSLEPGDTVRITRLRAGIDEDNVIDSLVIPLGADQPMTGQTRARQVSLTAAPPGEGGPESGALEADTSLSAATLLDAIGVAA